MPGRMPYINLLPWRGRIQKRNRCIIVFAILGFVALFAIGFLSFNKWYRQQVFQLNVSIQHTSMANAALDAQVIKTQSKLNLMQSKFADFKATLTNERPYQLKLNILIWILQHQSRLNLHHVGYADGKLKLSGSGKYQVLQSFRHALLKQYSTLTMELVEAKSHGGVSKWVIELL